MLKFGQTSGQKLSPNSWTDKIIFWYYIWKNEISSLTWISFQTSSSTTVPETECWIGTIRQWPSQRDLQLGRHRYTWNQCGLLDQGPKYRSHCFSRFLAKLLFILFWRHQNRCNNRKFTTSERTQKFQVDYEYMYLQAELHINIIILADEKIWWY